MKKYFPVILILATLTLSACGRQNEQIETVKTKTMNEEKTELKSLKDLLTMKGTQKCTFESKDGEVVTSSEIIISGNKFKQVTEVKNEEGIMKVYGVSDGVYFYSWNDKVKGNGLKMKMDEIENNTKNNQGEEKQQIDINKEYNYKCGPATLNESDLALPKEVKFVDYTEMMKGLQSGNLEDLKKLVPSQEE